MADPAMDPVTPGDTWERELTARLATLRALPEPPSFGPAATDQFLARLAAESPRHAPPAPPPQRRSALRWPALSVRLAGVAMAILLAVLGTGYAAAASLPGAPLYPLKRQAEELRVAFAAPDARDPIRRTLLEARRRELSALVAQQAPPSQVVAGVDEYLTAVAVAQVGGDSPALRAQLGEHRIWLSALETDAEPAVWPLLDPARQALEAAPSPERPLRVPPAPAAPTATAPPRATPTNPTPHTQPAWTAVPDPTDGDVWQPAHPTVVPPPATHMPASLTAVPPRPHRPTARPLPATAAPEPPGPEPTPESPPESPGPAAGPGPGPSSQPEPPGPGPSSQPEPPGPEPGSQPEPPGPEPGSQPEPPGPGSQPEPPLEPTSAPEPPEPERGGQPEPGQGGQPGRP